MPDDDSLLAQGTVDFRNEERMAAHGRSRSRSLCGVVSDADADDEIQRFCEARGVVRPGPDASERAINSFVSWFVAWRDGWEEADAVRDQGGNA